MEIIWNNNFLSLWQKKIIETSPSSDSFRKYPKVHDVIFKAVGKNYNDGQQLDDSSVLSYAIDDILTAMRKFSFLMYPNDEFGTTNRQEIFRIFINDNPIEEIISSCFTIDEDRITKIVEIEEFIRITFGDTCNEIKKADRDIKLNELEKKLKELRILMGDRDEEFKNSISYLITVIENGEFKFKENILHSLRKFLDDPQNSSSSNYAYLRHGSKKRKPRGES